MMISSAYSEEWAKTEIRLTAAKKRLADLLNDDKPIVWNRNYVVDIDLPLFIDTAVTGVFSIDDDHTFFCKGIEAFYTVTGTVSETDADSVTTDSPATMQIAESLRPQIFDYEWMIRDSGSDRDWGNIMLPSAVMRNGNMHGLRFAHGQARLRGGTQVTVTIDPTFFDSSSSATGVESFESHSLQFILSGVALRNGVL